jgi:hypothetical protein
MRSSYKSFCNAFGCSSNEEKKKANFEKDLAYFAEGKYKSVRLEFNNAIQIEPKNRFALEFIPEFAAAANNLAFILVDQDKDSDVALRLVYMAKE